MVSSLARSSLNMFVKSLLYAPRIFQPNRQLLLSANKRHAAILRRPFRNFAWHAACLPASKDGDALHLVVHGRQVRPTCDIHTTFLEC